VTGKDESVTKVAVVNDLKFLLNILYFHQI